MLDGFTQMVAEGQVLHQGIVLQAENKSGDRQVSNQGDADRQQRGVIAETQISVQKKQVVEASRAYANNM